MPARPNPWSGMGTATGHRIDANTCPGWSTISTLDASLAEIWLCENEDSTRSEWRLTLPGRVPVDDQYGCVCVCCGDWPTEGVASLSLCTTLYTYTVCACIPTRDVTTLWTDGNEAPTIPHSPSTSASFLLVPFRETGKTRAVFD
jgi:hypothetical protein